MLADFLAIFALHFLKQAKKFKLEEEAKRGVWDSNLLQSNSLSDAALSSFQQHIRKNKVKWKWYLRCGIVCKIRIYETLNCSWYIIFFP